MEKRLACPIWRMCGNYSWASDHFMGGLLFQSGLRHVQIILQDYFAVLYSQRRIAFCSLDRFLSAYANKTVWDQGV